VASSAKAESQRKRSKERIDAMESIAVHYGPPYGNRFLCIPVMSSSACIGNLPADDGKIVAHSQGISQANKPLCL
jgi:hypothetical protein